ncbi:MAG: protein kinase [Polyangiaceae bacterium]|nr:protein kinase [Polyangiaceae bacterium]
MKACPQCKLKYPTDKTTCFVDGAVLVEIQDPRIGTTVAGRYVLEDVIGEGGMATVYRAKHRVSDRHVAIKIMNPALAKNSVIQERFRREAKAAQKIAHPNIIEILEQGETGDGSLYLVMELLEGETLADVIEHGKVPVERTLRILIQVARALARAHDLEVIHRDLKPENIFLARVPDGSEVVKLLDFGIARSMQDVRLTGSGEVFGTPQYMAPERITSTEAGPAADLYALGIMAFEMFVGRLPFQAHDVATWFLKHMKEAPPSMRQFDPSLPEELDELVHELLAKDPSDRPVDAHKVHNDLGAIAAALGVQAPVEASDDVVSSHVPSTSERTAVDRWKRRLEVFELMLMRAYPQNRPPDMVQMLSQIKSKLGELAEVGASSSEVQLQLEAAEARGREGRQRLGHAVHALGVDASRAREDAKAADSTIAVQTAEVSRFTEDFLAAHEKVVYWEGRSGFMEPYAQLSSAYRVLADLVDAWLAAKRTLQQATQTAEAKRAEVSDLEFQIQTLRGALATKEESIEKEVAEGNRQLRELGERADGIETELLELATRFCSPLRARPELGALFTKLENVAA